MNNRRNHAPNPSQPNWLKRIAVAGGTTLALLGVYKAHDVHEGSQAKDAAIERDLQAIIDPVIDARGAEALDAYNAQPDKTKGNLHMHVDIKKGVAIIGGTVERKLTDDAQEYGREVSEMKVVMGLRDGAPNVEDTRYAWYAFGTVNEQDNIVSAEQLQLTAPGAEQYRSLGLPGDTQDGWSAAYGTSNKFGSAPVRGGSVSTDERDARLSTPALLPADSAHQVIKELPEITSEVLNSFNQSTT